MIHSKENKMTQVRKKQLQPETPKGFSIFLNDGNRAVTIASVLFRVNFNLYILDRLLFVFQN